MTVSNIAAWLQENTPLRLLGQESLLALANQVEERSVSAGKPLVQAGEVADGLYILLRGQLETHCSEGRRSEGEGDVGFLPGAVINLEALLLDQPVEKTVVALSEAQVWFISATQMQDLLRRYPDILQTFTRQLVEAVKRLSFQLNYEQERQILLRPYLVAKAKRGVIGKSRYAVRLRNQVREASNHRKSVLIFGEPGLEKDNLAALIHYSSADRRELIVQVDCSKLQASGADLFGRVGGKPGLLEALGRGTLVLNNVQELPKELLPAIATLLRTATYRPVRRPDGLRSPEKTAEARLILISEKAIPALDGVVEYTLKVPPLRVRKADIEDQVTYYISLICRRRGIDRVRTAPEAIRRLQAYDFPNNLRELENLVERAVAQMLPGGVITEELIWPSQSKKKQFRLNLLNTYPQLRQFLRSPWWPDRINYGFTLWAFALVVAVLFWGPQTRDRNVALLFFWAWWWPLVLISFPFVGRLWCSVCPFMIYGEVTQKLSQWLFPNRKLQTWPRQQAERWGGWFLFGLFALILIWEEVWRLENTAYLSACLLLLITAGAMIFSALFERRFWCRYLCPIGGMNGLFAKLAVTELRAQQGTCSAECTTYQCYKGGPQKGEGLETNGCPLYSHPAQLEDNRDCVLCMTCLKACPHRSVEFNLRPPGIELWTTHVPRSYEVALMFLLLGAVYLHRLPELQSRLGLTWDLSAQGVHALVSVGLLGVGAIAPLLAQAMLRLIYRFRPSCKPKPFLTLAYGYLPLVWVANLAHYLQLGLAEGGRVLPISLATVGLPSQSLPIWVAHPAVIAFLQGGTLLGGLLLTIWLTHKIARQPLRQLWPQHLASVGIASSTWWLILG
ncbi:MAG TPA: cyclic nucleotide-binding domain-containing protein [Trichocoleus sp.]